MLTKLTYDKHRVDEKGNPAGGATCGVGFTINWQDGPLGRGDDRLAPNGAFVETVISAVASRLQFYQSSKFRCPENAKALGHLHDALNILNNRTCQRENRGVEGTHEI